MWSYFDNEVLFIGCEYVFWVFYMISNDTRLVDIISYQFLAS